MRGQEERGHFWEVLQVSVLVVVALKRGDVCW